jgi:hypothetical protein
MKITSFRILLTNIFTCGLIVILAETGVLESIELFNILLLPIYWYVLFSVFFAIYGIYIGAKGIKANSYIKVNTIGVIGNGIYFSGYIYKVVELWPALMGI